MLRKYFTPLFLCAVTLFLGGSSCGVKGPPLPPVADTPMDSDRINDTEARPSPTPSPTPSPRPKRRSR